MANSEDKVRHDAERIKKELDGLIEETSEKKFHPLVKKAIDSRISNLKSNYAKCINEANRLRRLRNKRLG